MTDAAPLIAPQTATITTIGCAPSTPLAVEFLEVLQPQPGQDPGGGASLGSSIIAPVLVAPGPPDRFHFQTPPAPPASLFSFKPIIDDPDCALESGPSYWLAGNSLDITLILAGRTELRLASAAGFAPCDDPVDSGELARCWVVESGLTGALSGVKHPFKWATDLPSAKKALLQASVWPFPTDAGQDFLAPPGLVKAWDVASACPHCDIDLTPLSAEPPGPPDSGSSLGVKEMLAAGGIVIAIGAAAAGAKPVAAGGLLLAGLVLVAPTGDGPSHGAAGSGPSEPGSTMQQQLASVEGAIDAYYFRVVELTEGGAIAGAPSNTVRLNWQETDLLVSLDNVPPPAPANAKLTVEILSYHSVLPSVVSWKCFIVTKPSDGKWIANHSHASPALDTDVDHLFIGFPFLDHPYAAGDVLCPPDPPEGCDWDNPDACVDEFIDWAAGAWEWAVQAYEDLQAAVVETVGQFVPDELCDDSCLAVALKVALTAMGIPPEIPSFDQLMQQGIDYLAEQAMGQIGIPDTAALQELVPAEVWAQGEQYAADWFEEQAEAQIKAGIEKGIQDMQKSFADEVDWLPGGVPVQPDDPTPPTAMLRVTDEGDGPGCGGILNLTSWVKNSFAGNLDALATWNAGKAPGFAPVLAGKEYPLYKTQVIPVPCIDQGDYLDIPVVLIPDAGVWYKPFQHLGTGKEMEFWWFVFRDGEARLIATAGSNFDEWNGPADVGLKP